MNEGEQSRQVRYLILIAAVLCAVIIGYNAFYVPDAPLTEPVVTVDSAASAASLDEEYTPSSVSQIIPQNPSSCVPGNPESFASAGAGSSGTAKKININTATAQQLSDGLNGIGDGLAERIVAYRQQHGAFRTIDQIKNVSGIGDKKYEEIQSSITVG